ncbi:ribokinase [Robertmurraya massiliosenegalensis]|uniref:ribokinase n=1 Tax=Robertmurraya massiliosenegalensis TaxID=1287657 RepID=UPI000311AD26|nr:ribokinase [Robertmurraya massiliosenegalensis]
MKKIAVIGSINIDYFVESKIVPKFGETVTGENFFMAFGGKGANQAVSASRLGGDVTLFGSIGNDEQKEVLLHHFINEKVNTEHLNIVDGVSTGAAFIELHNSENRIIIVPGANQYTNISYIEKNIERLLEHDVFLFQMEIPLETIEFLIPILFKHRKIIVLDPAPAQHLAADILDKVSYLTPNEHEFALVLNEQENQESALKSYPNKLIITEGEKGVSFYNGTEIIKVPARQTKAVDTTGAGDTFTGAFTVGISEGKALEECIRFGTIAASIAVTKKGAQAGMPYKQEIESVLKEG